MEILVGEWEILELFQFLVSGFCWVFEDLKWNGWCRLCI